MGVFTYPMTLIGPEGEVTVEATVDTASTFNVLPRDVLERIGVLPKRASPFELGDGRIVQYEVGDVLTRIDTEQRITPCVFGDPDVDPLLGAVTLETFLLSVDPVGKRLVPVRGYIL